MLAGAALLFAPLQLAYGAEKIAPAQYPPVFGDNLPPAPVATTPAPTPTSVPLPPPITLPAVAAPLQTVIVNSNERPAAPPVPVNANTISQVAVDGRFVNINIAPQKSPTPGTVGVAVTGDGFNFSLSTTSDNGGKTTIGSVSIINGQPVVNTPQQTTINTTGTGFKPDDQISIYVFSVGKFLGNVKTSGIGEFNANVKLPDLPIGLHHFQATGLTSEGKTRTITLFMNITPETVAKPAAQSSRLLIILTVILLIIVQALVFIWRLLGKRRKKEKQASEALEVKSKRSESSFDADEINARIEAMVKRQALSKKRASVKKKAAAKKAAVRKKSSKV